MRQRVIIEPWDCNENDVHVHIEDFDSIFSMRGDVANSVTPGEVIQIGRMAGVLKRISENKADLDLPGGCAEFCQMIEEIKGLADYQIAEARGQMEDLLDYDETPPNMSDLEVAYLDWKMRQILSEQANECKNPFLEKIEIRNDPREFLNDYFKRTREQ